MGPVETPRRNLTGAIVPALAVAGLAAIGAMWLVGANGFGGKQTAPPRDCILENADGIGGPIDLVDGNGAHVTQADFAGEPAVVYFGFTHCPDMCPGAMYQLSEALALPGGYDVQPILISFDPARDTPERMRAFVRTEGFPAGLTGLTGTPEQTGAAARAFQVYYSQVGGGSPETYDFDHSSLLYVLDGNWRTVAAMQTMRPLNPMDPRSPAAPVAPEEIAACIAAGLERGVTS
ncbi:MAG: SCO family protein [Hyphomonadaceae bacterium]